jgi:hypothetical protein
MQSWREEALQHGLEHARRPLTLVSPKLTSHQLETQQYSPRKPPVPRPVTAPDGMTPRALAAAGARKAADDESTRRAAALQSQLEAATLQLCALRDAHEALALRCAKLETSRRRSEDGLARQRRALARTKANTTLLAQSKEDLAAAAQGAERSRLDLTLGLNERARELREAVDREAELRRTLAVSEAAVARLAAEAASERQTAGRLAEDKAGLAERLGALRQTHELTRVELLQESGATLGEGPFSGMARTFVAQLDTHSRLPPCFTLASHSPSSLHTASALLHAALSLLPTGTPQLGLAHLQPDLAWLTQPPSPTH